MSTSGDNVHHLHKETQQQFISKFDSDYYSDFSIDELKKLLKDRCINAQRSELEDLKENQVLREVRDQLRLQLETLEELVGESSNSNFETIFEAIPDRLAVYTDAGATPSSESVSLPIVSEKLQSDINATRELCLAHEKALKFAKNFIETEAEKFGKVETRYKTEIVNLRKTNESLRNN